MKAMFQRFLTLLKSLFLRLRVMVTLQCGRDKVNKEDGAEEEAQKGKDNEK